MQGGLVQYRTGRAAELGGQMLQNMFRYRHNVFVDTLKWPLLTDGVHEIDQYDRQDTIYVMAEASPDCIAGVARLLPTTGPYLLQEIFPELVSYIDLPQSESVWELSRFAATAQAEGHDDEPDRHLQFSAELSTSLLREVIVCALRQGARQLIMVSSVAAERLMRRCGFKPIRAGVPKQVDGEWIAAFLLDIAQTHEAAVPHVGRRDGLPYMHAGLG